MGAGGGVERLEAMLAHLRAVSVWEAEQTHRSLVAYAVEETAELVEAIETDAPDADLCGELGDVLLQVIFHAAIAAERGAFDLADVARGLREKIERRQPAATRTDGEVMGAAEAEAEWERRKARERPRRSPLDGIPPDHLLEPLARAQKILARTGRAVGERGERVSPDEIGTELLAVVARAQASGVDAAQALRAAVRSVEARVGDD